LTPARPLTTEPTDRQVPFVRGTQTHARSWAVLRELLNQRSRERESQDWCVFVSSHCTAWLASDLLKSARRCGAGGPEGSRFILQAGPHGQGIASLGLPVLGPVCVPSQPRTTVTSVRQKATTNRWPQGNRHLSLVTNPPEEMPNPRSLRTRGGYTGGDPEAPKFRPVPAVRAPNGTSNRNDESPDHAH